MASVRGSTGPIVDAGGNGTIAWPAGSAAADLAVLWDTSNGQDPRGPVVADGWTYRGGHVWTKPIMASDLASPLAVKGTITSLQVWADAAGVGAYPSYKSTMRVKANGGAFYSGWLSPRYSGSNIAAATYRRGSQVVDPEDYYAHAMFARTSVTAASLALDGVHRSAEWFVLEILPLAAPSASEWVSPAAGSVVDVTQELELDFTHRSNSGSEMDAARVTVRQVSGSWQWVKSDGTLSATQVDLVQATPRAIVAAATFPAGVQLEAQAYTHDAGGWSSGSAILTPLTTRTPPTLTLALTTGLDNLTPTVTLAFTPGFGSMQSWELALCDAADASPSSPLVIVPMAAGSVASWSASPADVVDSDGRLVFAQGQSVRAWGRAADSALTSAWAYSTAQTISWTPPDPVGSAVFVDAAGGQPAKLAIGRIPAASMRLSVDWETDADVWESVVPTLVGAVASVDVPVPHAPYGVARRYRVASWEAVDGVLVPSSYVATTASASTDLGGYFVSTDGSEWVPARTPRGADMDRVRAQGVSVSYWVPEPDAVGVEPVAQVDRTPAAGWSGTLALIALTDDEADALVSWVTTRDSWLWRQSPERASGTLADQPLLTIAATSQPTVARRVGANVQLREVRFAWSEC